MQLTAAHISHCCSKKLEAFPQSQSTPISRDAAQRGPANEPRYLRNCDLSGWGYAHLEPRLIENASTVVKTTRA